eukprot:12624588-Alexandrium_andersonii.AAC.1
MSASLVGSEMCIRDRFLHRLGFDEAVFGGCAYGLLFSDRAKQHSRIQKPRCTACWSSAPPAR